MNLKHLESERELEAWDRFLRQSPRGHYAQLSSWLKSFSSYGASRHIIALYENDEIVGGIGMLIFGKGMMKLVSLPVGPIIQSEFDHYTEQLIEEGVRFAKSIGAFLFQMRSPYKEGRTSPFLLNSLSLPRRWEWHEGFPFNVAATPNLLFLVDLKRHIEEKEEWEDAMLTSFKSNCRRDIRRSIRNGLTLKEAVGERELFRAYGVIQHNADTKGYSVRSWEQFGSTLIEQVRKGEAKVLTVWYDEQLLAVHYGTIAGRRYSYMMGGTIRTERDYLAGHFLHWHVIRTARKLGLEAYDFTSLGSPGVLRFKQGFNPELIEFGPSHYVVLSPIKFRLFQRIVPWLKKNKATVAKFAHRLTRR